ncbi:MAG: hypothetical protein OSJ54_10000 [Oscillospiraceae bacterium]|nr:hypothetical protein [Oscillospiraceae bacterium]
MKESPKNLKRKCGAADLADFKCALVDTGAGYALPVTDRKEAKYEF